MVALCISLIYSATTYYFFEPNTKFISLLFEQDYHIVDQLSTCLFGVELIIIILIAIFLTSTDLSKPFSFNEIIASTHPDNKKVMNLLQLNTLAS